MPYIIHLETMNGSFLIIVAAIVQYQGYAYIHRLAPLFCFELNSFLFPFSRRKKEIVFEGLWNGNKMVEVKCWKSNLISKLRRKKELK